MQQTQTPKQLHTTFATYLYNLDMNPHKGWAAASPPPTPFGDGFEASRGDAREYEEDQGQLARLRSRGSFLSHVSQLKGALI